MSYSIRRTTQFKKDVKLLLKKNKNIDELFLVIKNLAEGKSLESKYRDHSLKGKYKDKRDCHIEPDWILIYGIEDEELVLYRTGTHALLFN